MSSSSVNNHENDGEDEKEKRLFYCECEKG